VDLIPSIRSTFEFSKLRADLNNVGTAFDEDTQRSIDRISRIILQDIAELETASAFKGGGRSEIRRGNVEKKLVKVREGGKSWSESWSQATLAYRL